MAKAPGETGTTRKTRRKEEGESFMAGRIRTSGNPLAGGGGGGGGSGGGHCVTLAWSLQSELP